MRAPKLLQFLTVATAMLAAYGRAGAKSLDWAYVTSGGVYDSEAMTSLPGVQVTPFLNDSTEAYRVWDINARKSVPIITDSRGRFSARFFVPPSSFSFLGIHVPRQGLHHLTLVLSAPGYVTSRVTIKVRPLTKKAAEGFVVTLPPLPLRPEVHHAS